MQCVHKTKMTKYSIKADSIHTGSYFLGAVDAHSSPTVQCTKKIEEMLAAGENKNKLWAVVKTAIFKYNQCHACTPSEHMHL